MVLAKAERDSLPSSGSSPCPCCPGGQTLHKSPQNTSRPSLFARTHTVPLPISCPCPLLKALQLSLQAVALLPCLLQQGEMLCFSFLFFFLLPSQPPNTNTSFTSSHPFRLHIWGLFEEVLSLSPGVSIATPCAVPRLWLLQLHSLARRRLVPLVTSRGNKEVAPLMLQRGSWASPPKEPESLDEAGGEETSEPSPRTRRSPFAS